MDRVCAKGEKYVGKTSSPSVLPLQRPHVHSDTDKESRQGPPPPRIDARVAAFLIIGILSCSVPPLHADALKRHHVELNAPADRSARLTALISACADAVNELVGVAKSPDATIRVSLDTPPPGPSRPLSVVLMEEESPVSAVHALTLVLLTRHVICRSGSDAKRSPPRDLDWLAAAAAHAVLCGSQPGMLSENSDFASVHPAYEKGVFPNLARLVQKPVPPQYGLAYRLYAVHCHVLATALRSTLPRGNTVLGPLLDMHAKSCSATESISATLAPYLRPAETVQAWYEHAVLGISRRSGGAATVERVQERLKELESVPMVVPGGGAFGCVLVPIDEVPRHMEKYRPDADALGATRVAMYDLMKEAP